MRTGRFASGAATVARRYRECLSFDCRLYRHDIAGSIADTAALSAFGILNSDQLERISHGLREIEKEIAGRQIRVG